MSDQDKSHTDTPSVTPDAETMGFPNPSRLLPSEIGIGLEAASQADEPNPQIRGYRVVGPLGRGGMGTVWRAVQLGTGREVALKLMSARMFASDNARRWFEREVRLHARLDHPHIARIYESGLDQGIYFYAMELVDGAPLDKYVRERRLSRRQIIELLRLVCSAVQHAHQRQVIHLDLKPSNILVTPEGQPRVLDFGLAQALGHDIPILLSETTVVPRNALPGSDPSPSYPLPSRSGFVAGTPGYMSPQMVTGKETGETRCDVYSLGVILYRLLTGHSPHDLSGSKADVVGRIAKNDPIPPRKVNARLDTDIEAIILKAMAREADNRYGSPGELASDLALYLAGRPIAARGHGMAYVTWKWLTRHHLKVIPAVVACVLVIGTLIHQEYRYLAEQELGRLRAEASLGQSLVYEGHGLAATGRPGSAVEAFDRAIRLLSQSGRATNLELDVVRWSRNQASPPPLLTLAGHEGGTTSVALFSDQRRAVSGGADRVVRIWELPTGRCVNEVSHGERVNAVALSPDEKWIISGTEDGKVRYWPVESQNADVMLNDVGDQQAVHSVAWDPKTVSGGPPARALTAHHDGSVVLWDIAKGTVIKKIAAHRGAATCVAFDATGQFALSLGGDQKLRRWTLATDEAAAEALLFVRDGCEKFALAPLASENMGGPQVLCETFGLAFNLTVLKEMVHLRGVLDPNYSPSCSFAIAADGGEGLVACEDGSIKLIEFRGEPRVGRIYSGHSKPVRAMAFAVNGPYRRLMISGSDDGTIKVWDLGRMTNREARVLPLTGLTAREISFSRDGRLALASGEDGNHSRASANIIDVSTGRVVRAIDQGNGVSRFDAAGIVRVFVPPYQGPTIQSSAAVTSNRAGPNVATPTPGAMSDDCRIAVCPSVDGSGFQIWDVAAASARGPFGIIPNTVIVSLALSGDEVSPRSGGIDRRFVVIGRSDGSVSAWNIADGTLSWSKNVHQGMPVNSVALSRDGNWVLSGGEDGALVRWDAKSGQDRKLGYTRGPIGSVAIHPAGTLAVVGVKADSAGYIWHIPLQPDMEATELLTLSSEGSQLSAVAFAPITDRVVVMTSDIGFSMRIWDLSRAASFAARAASLGVDQPAPPTGFTDLSVLGDWYAERRRSDWASEVLELARSRNQNVSPEVLAKSYLDRPNRKSGALDTPDAKLAELARTTFNDSSWYGRYFRESIGGAPGPMHIYEPASGRNAQWPSPRPDAELISPPGAIDLLPGAKLPSEWERNASDGSVASPAGGAQQLTFESPIPGAYDYRLVFTRVSGNDGIGAVLGAVTSSGPFSFQCMVGARRNSVIGLRHVDGADVHDNDTTRRHAAGITNGEKQVLVLQVRPIGVKAILNGVPVFHVDDYRRLADPKGNQAMPQLGVTTYNSRVVFHQAQRIDVSQ